MATHSSIPTWKMLWTKESDGLQSKGLQRVWHKWISLHPSVMFSVIILVIILKFYFRKPYVKEITNLFINCTVVRYLTKTF